MQQTRLDAYNRRVYALIVSQAILWLGGCVVMILVYSILFNLSPEFVNYYERCEASGVETVREDDVNDVRLWALVSEGLGLRLGFCALFVISLMSHGHW